MDSPEQVGEEARVSYYSEEVTHYINLEAAFKFLGPKGMLKAMAQYASEAQEDTNRQTQRVEWSFWGEDIRTLLTAADKVKH